MPPISPFCLSSFACTRDCIYVLNEPLEMLSIVFGPAVKEKEKYEMEQVSPGISVSVGWGSAWGGWVSTAVRGGKGNSHPLTGRGVGVGPSLLMLWVASASCKPLWRMFKFSTEWRVCPRSNPALPARLARPPALYRTH